MSNSRTINSVRNATVAIAMQILNTIVGIVSRTIFIKLLGNDYLSVNGLFANILTLLSFAELGIGNAIIFALYKPVADNDEKRICEVLNLYKKAFRIIATTIVCLGICIIPFLSILVRDVPDVKENIILIYIIFVVSTSTTYIFSYKNSLIIASQQNYVIAFFKEAFTILRVVTQIIFLIFTHNYIGYLVIEIIFALLNNLACKMYAERKFPYLQKYKDARLPMHERAAIFKDVKSLFVYKAGAAILNGTDNIIISGLLKTTYVGICSNYTLVINTLSSLLMQACSSITASIGNHNVVSNPKEREKKFREINSVSYFIFGFSSVCLAVLLNVLIQVWLGDSYLLDKKTVIAMVLTFFLTGLNQIPSTYRMTLGLFKQARLVPFSAAVINIALSILLGKIFGLFGVFIATSIAKILTFSLFDPILIYRNGFNQSPMKYYIVYILRLLIVATLYIVNDFIVSIIYITGIYGLCIKTIVCVLVTGTSLLIILLFDRDFRDVITTIKGIVFNKRFSIKDK